MWRPKGKRPLPTGVFLLCVDDEFAPLVELSASINRSSALQRRYYRGVVGIGSCGTLSTSLPVNTIGPVATPVGEPPSGSTVTA